MTPEYKGGITGIVVMIPVLVLVTAALNGSFADDYGFTIMILTFLAVNLVLALFFSTRRSGPDRLRLFVGYSLITLASTVLLGLLLFFICLSLGLLPFRKIGG